MHRYDGLRRTLLLRNRQSTLQHAHTRYTRYTMMVHPLHLSPHRPGPTCLDYDITRQPGHAPQYFSLPPAPERAGAHCSRSNELGVLQCCTWLQSQYSASAVLRRRVLARRAVRHAITARRAVARPAAVLAPSRVAVLAHNLPKLGAGRQLQLSSRELPPQHRQRLRREVAA